MNFGFQKHSDTKIDGICCGAMASKDDAVYMNCERVEGTKIGFICKKSNSLFIDEFEQLNGTHCIDKKVLALVG